MKIISIYSLPELFLKIIKFLGLSVLLPITDILFDKHMKSFIYLPLYCYFLIFRVTRVINLDSNPQKLMVRYDGGNHDHKLFQFKIFI